MTAPLEPSVGARPAIVCRQLKAGDLESTVALLCRGFPERAPGYWRRAFQRLAARDVPEGLPRYGYVMSDHGVPVGIVLLISAVADDGRRRINISSWYVEPAYRGYSSVMMATPFKLKDVTFFNVSPAPNTLETIAAQGFRPYVGGTFHALVALARPVRGVTIEMIAATDAQDSSLLQRCAAAGCLAFEATHGTERFPFAFLPRRFFGDRLPGAQLVYCRDMAEFVRFAGPLGRRLSRHGVLSVMIDANGPIAGLPGWYLPGRRQKFFRGDPPPRLGDLTETELLLFKE